MIAQFKYEEEGDAGEKKDRQFTALIDTDPVTNTAIVNGLPKGLISYEIEVKKNIEIPADPNDETADGNARTEEKLVKELVSYETEINQCNDLAMIIYTDKYD